MDQMSEAFVALERVKRELLALRKQVDGSEAVTALVKALAVRLGVVERRPPDRLRLLEARLDSVELRLVSAETASEERETLPPPPPSPARVEPSESEESAASLLEDVANFFGGPDSAESSEPPPPE